jgi:anti-sigma B factor antagonist
MPATPFHTRLSREADGITLVEVAGEIDMHTSQELAEVLAEALRDEPEHLEVDLSAVGFIDSTGLSVLVQNAKLALAGTTSFEIVCPDKRLMQVFDITGLSDVLTFRSTCPDGRA